QPAALPPPESTELWPSKLAIGVGAASAAGTLCTAGSTKPSGTGRFGLTRSRSRSTSRGPGDAAVGKSRTAGVTTLAVEVMTAGLKAPGSDALVVVDDVGAAQLSIPSKPPAEQRMKPRKMRGLKKPDLEVEFFFMEITEPSLGSPFS